MSFLKGLQPHLKIARSWIATGNLSTTDRGQLKKVYLSEIGAKPSCTECESFYSEMRDHFMTQLRDLNQLVKMKTRKYQIRGGKGAFLQLPGQSSVVVNEGEKSEDREILTDSRAEEILKEFPGYSELIEINPIWQAEQDGIKSAQELSKSSEANEGDSDELKALKKEHTKATGDLAKLQEKFDKLKADNDALKAENSELKKSAKASAKSKPADPAVAPTVPAQTGTAVVDPATTAATEPTGDSGTVVATTGNGSEAPTANAPAETNNDIKDATQGAVDANK